MNWPTVKTLVVVAALSVPAPVLFIGGCDAQVEPQYRGEPLATIHGSVVTQGTPAPSSMDVVIAWTHRPAPVTPGTSLPPPVGSPATPPTFVGTKVSVTGSFPANFTLNLYDPPPADQQMRLGYDYRSANVPGDTDGGPSLSGMWIGYIAAVSTGASDGPLNLSDVLGVDTEHMVIYFDHDDVPLVLPADASIDALPPSAYPTSNRVYVAFSSAYFKVPWTKGYHLAKVDTRSQAETAQITTCLYGGLCVHIVNAMGENQSYNDWNFARCMRLLPSNPTCIEAYGADGGLNSPASMQCAALVGAAQNATSPWGCYPDGGIFMGTQFANNPDGLADPVAIELGTTIWDGFFAVATAG